MTLIWVCTAYEVRPTRNDRYIVRRADKEAVFASEMPYIRIAKSGCIGVTAIHSIYFHVKHNYGLLLEELRPKGTPSVLEDTLFAIGIAHTW